MNENRFRYLKKRAEAVINQLEKVSGDSGRIHIAISKMYTIRNYLTLAEKNSAKIGKLENSIINAEDYLVKLAQHFN